MKPVFRKELEYLKFPNMDAWTDKLWVNLRAYVAFNRETGERVVLGRKVDKIPWDSSDYMTHEEFFKKHWEETTEAKVENERDKLLNWLNENEVDEVVVSVSGGKDSTVLEHMTRDIYNKYPHMLLFGNTSNETHYTYKYVKDMYSSKALHIANPKVGFYEWCDTNGFIPSKLGRACCTIFKEGNITPYLKSLGKESKKLIHLVGIRASESPSRSAYTQVKKGKWESKEADKNWNMYLPIFSLTDMDIWAYLFHHKVPFNVLYEFGYERVGCQACAFRRYYELELNKHFLPTYHAKWQKLLEKVFIREGFAVRLNCTLQEYLDGLWKGSDGRTTATDEVVREFASYRGLSYEDAQKYFIGYKCQCCGKSLPKDVIAMNIKTLGTNSTGRMCLKCLANYLETDIKSLKAGIIQHKEEGCKWF